jgi:hypothetical protein
MHRIGLGVDAARTALGEAHRTGRRTQTQIADLSRLAGIVAGAAIGRIAVLVHTSGAAENLSHGTGHQTPIGSNHAIADRAIGGRVVLGASLTTGVAGGVDCIVDCGVQLGDWRDEGARSSTGRGEKRRCEKE